MSEYLGSDPSTTLGEAMQKMRDLEPENLAQKASTTIARALDLHDAVHVLFDLDTSIQDEIAAHVWMMLATTADMSEIHCAIATKEHRNILSEIGHLKSLAIWFSSLPQIFSILFKSLQMKRKISIEDLFRLKEQSVLEIRREHGIVL